MAKTKAKERELLDREGEVTGWRAEVWAHSFDGNEETRERRARPSISVLGAFTQDVKGVSQFDILVIPGKPYVGDAEIPCVGVIRKIKPMIEASVTLADTEYQTILALVTTGNLRHFSCSFQTPRYGSALISSLTFSSHKPIE